MCHLHDAVPSQQVAPPLDEAALGQHEGLLVERRGELLAVLHVLERRLGQLVNLRRWLLTSGLLLVLPLILGVGVDEQLCVCVCVVCVVCVCVCVVCRRSRL